MGELRSNFPNEKRRCDYSSDVPVARRSIGDVVQCPRKGLKCNERETNMCTIQGQNSGVNVGEDCT